MSGNINMNRNSITNVNTVSSYYVTIDGSDGVCLEETGDQDTPIMEVKNDYTRDILLKVGYVSDGKGNSGNGIVICDPYYGGNCNIGLFISESYESSPSTITTIKISAIPNSSTAFNYTNSVVLTGLSCNGDDTCAATKGFVMNKLNAIKNQLATKGIDIVV